MTPHERADRIIKMVTTGELQPDQLREKVADEIFDAVDQALAELRQEDQLQPEEEQ